MHVYIATTAGAAAVAALTFAEALVHSVYHVIAAVLPEYICLSSLARAHCLIFRMSKIVKEMMMTVRMMTMMVKMMMMRMTI